ncbi:gap junction delta-4 protein-like [Menidia menidia]
MRLIPLAVFAGKSWWTLALAPRLLLLVLAGFPLFGGEQEGFSCSSLQPGCSIACFDSFAPVSVLRLWLLHLLLLCLLHLTFLTYVTHRQRCLKVREPPRERGAYLLVVVLRILLEILGSGGQIYVFGSAFPRRVLCYEAPCTSGVECYVSRPTEKTLMLNFMLAAASFSLLLSLVDLLDSVRGMVSLRRKRETLMEEMSKGEQSSVVTTTTGMEDAEVPLISPKINALKSADEGRKVLVDESLESPSVQSESRNLSRLKTPLSQRKTANGDKNLGRFSPFGESSKQPSDCNQDKRAWV